MIVLYFQKAPSIPVYKFHYIWQQLKLDVETIYETHTHIHIIPVPMVSYL